MPRDFERDLQASGSSKFRPFWDYHYRQMFPEMLDRTYATTRHSGGGTDCIVHPGDIGIDEKIRPDKDYGDILLEYEHHYANGTVAPGWIEKDLDIDWIAYGVYPANRVTWLGWPTLQIGWRRCGERWKKDYSLPPASTTHEGRTWQTYNVAIPVSELRCWGVIIVVTYGPIKNAI